MSVIRVVWNSIAISGIVRTMYAHSEQALKADQPGALIAGVCMIGVIGFLIVDMFKPIKI